MVAWNMNFIFPDVGKNNPNWLSLIFFRGVGFNHQPDIFHHNKLLNSPNSPSQIDPLSQSDESTINPHSWQLNAHLPPCFMETSRIIHLRYHKFNQILPHKSALFLVKPFYIPIKANFYPILFHYLPTLQPWLCFWKVTYKLSVNSVYIYTYNN